MVQHPRKIRLDKLLVAKGLCRSRNQAQQFIASGYVEVKSGASWEVIQKPGLSVSCEQLVRISDNPLKHYVSRAALKLLAAFERHPLNINGLRALDLGQSTGGFTQVLLNFGAAKVVGVEVGHSQLAKELKRHPRVTCLEGTNARELSTQLHQQLSWEDRGCHGSEVAAIDRSEKPANPELFDLAVMDLSFISQTLIVPELRKVLKQKAPVFSLVKPQFEVGREALGKGGIVSNSALLAKVEDKITQLYSDLGFSVVDYFPSPIKGSDGNSEFFIHAEAPATSTSPLPS